MGYVRASARRGRSGTGTIRSCVTLVALATCGATLKAQISMTTAVDLALRSSPRVQSAAADVAKATAQVAEAMDVYIPSVSLGAGYGQSYGYSPNPPTLFNITAQSLVYSSAQFYYIRSARAGLTASQLALKDMQEEVAQEAALDYLALEHDQERAVVAHQEEEDADRLVSIVQARVDAGQDPAMDLTQAKLTAAQFRLAAMRATDDTEGDRERLARLIDLPAISLQAGESFPTGPVPPDAGSTVPGGAHANAAVASAFAAAKAKQEQADGDSHSRYRPQLTFFAQYNNYATFTNSFATLQNLQNRANTIGANEGAFGVQIVVPFFDKGKSAKARESAADASKSLHDAEHAEIQALDGQSRLRRSLAEIQVQTEVASLQQQLAQQQLEVLQVQMKAGTPGAPLATPKDEQKARISEREKYLGVVDATYQLHQAQIQLLRQEGRLGDWLRAAGHSPATPQSPAP